MHHPLAGKVALVTGGAKRVGRAIALRLAEEGMDVAITFNTSAAEAEQTVRDIRQTGRQAHALKVDLATPDAARCVQELFSHHFDRLDALVNNAAIYEPTPMGEVSADAFDRHMAINARTPLLLIQQFADLLGARYKDGDPSTAGRVVSLIDAQTLHSPQRGYAAYNASKAALLEITTTSAVELAPRVTVNAVAPGVVAWADGYTPDQRERYMSRVPMGHMGSPSDVAAAVAYLIRDAGYCTGQTIRVDGGRSLT
jgi:pteridine reductase